MRGALRVALAVVLGSLLPTSATAQRMETRFELASETVSASAPMEWRLADSHARTGFIVGGTIGAFAAGAVAGLFCLALDGTLVDCGFDTAVRAVLTGGVIGGATGGALGFVIGALIPRENSDGGDS